jgi:isoprenylcysteine carboxyl methyltransferase (ICMT) family protein YpbQ
LRMVGAQRPTKIAVSRLPEKYSASEMRIEDQGSAHVDTLATVHMVYLLESLLDALYPAANFANRERIASLLRRRPNFGEFYFHALR